MKTRGYQFMILEEWELEKNSFDKRSFGKRLADAGLEGWYVVAINYVKKGKKLYMSVMMQRDLGK